MNPGVRMRVTYTAVLEYDAEDHPEMTPDQARQNMHDLINRDPSFGDIEIDYVTDREDSER